jgi:hypothetical protein
MHSSQIGSHFILENKSTNASRSDSYLRSGAGLGKYHDKQVLVKPKMIDHVVDGGNLN